MQYVYKRAISYTYCKNKYIVCFQIFSKRVKQSFMKMVYLKKPKITNKIPFSPNKSKTNFFALLEFQKEKRQKSDFFLFLKQASRA